MASRSGMSARSAMRSLTRDPAVKDLKLKTGTIPRILEFAKPFKLYLFLFLLTIIADSFLTVASPLLLKNLIDKGVIPKDGRVVTTLALIVGVIALVDTHASVRTYSKAVDCLFYPHSNWSFNFAH